MYIFVLTLLVQVSQSKKANNCQGHNQNVKNIFKVYKLDTSEEQNCDVVVALKKVKRYFKNLNFSFIPSLEHQVKQKICTERWLDIRRNKF